MSTEILNGMAKAFFTSAYADLMDDLGSPMQGEIMDQLPTEIDPAAITAAKTLYKEFEANLGLKLDDAYVKLHGIDMMPDQDPETFGHYAAMQAMGHGVGLWEYCCSQLHSKVPYLEFSQYDFENSYAEEAF